MESTTCAIPGQLPRKGIDGIASDPKAVEAHSPSSKETCKEFIVMSSYLMYDSKLDTKLSPGIQRAQVSTESAVTCYCSSL